MTRTVESAAGCAPDSRPGRRDGRPGTGPRPAGFRLPSLLSALRLAAALAVSVLFLPGCGPEPEPVLDDGPEAVRVPQQILEGVHLRETSTRGLLWILEADQGLSYGPNEPTSLDNLRVRFYDGGTEVKSILTSKRGVVDEQTRSITALDSVVVVTPKGERLETEELHWDPDREQVTTEVYFRFTRGGDVLTGVGIRAEPDLSRYEILRDVRAEMVDQKDTELLEALDGDSTAGP